MFDVGQKVVCIDDNFPVEAYERLWDTPIEGATYTVRDIVPGVLLSGQETCAVLLVEVLNPQNQVGVESGFAAWRFRPLEEMLHKKKERETETIENQY